MNCAEKSSKKKRNASMVDPSSAGTVFIRSDSDYKDGPRTELIKIFTMVADPRHRCSNEAGRAITKTFLMMQN